MELSFRDRIANWIVLLTLALTGVAPSQDFVLCFEPDGTIALESVDLGRACGVETDAEESEHLCAPTPACCACFDVPIGGLEDERQLARNATDVRPFLPALPPVLLVSARLEFSARTRVVERVDERPSGVLTRLRTDVLRL